MRTHFKKVQWKNMFATGPDWIEVRLDRYQGSLFLGKNGCGKSTMIDALCFCLYKKPFRKITLPEMVNTQTNKNLLVEVEFEAGGAEYLIRRGYKPAVFEVFKNGDLLEQNAVGGDYQAFLENHILSMDFNSFIQIVILGFANYTPFMKLTAPKRREVVEALLSYQVFGVMNSILKEKIKEAKPQFMLLDGQINSCQAKIDLNKKHMESIKADHAAMITTKKDSLKGIQQDIMCSQQQLENKTHEMDTLLASVADKQQIEMDIKKAEDTRNQLVIKVREIQKEITFYGENENCPTCRQPISREFVDDRLENRKKKKEELEQAITKLVSIREPWIERLAQINTVLAEATDMNAEIRGLNSEIRAYQQQADSIRREVSELEKKAKEDEYQDIGAELQADMDELLEQKEKLIANGDLHAKAALLLQDSGIKARLIRNFVPIMNELVNKYLQELQFFGHFEMDENFDAVIRAHHRDELSYEGLSQGQKLRIDLALLFTWRSIAKMRSNASTNLLIFDEILDSSLDDDGIEDLLRVLNQMTEGHNIFIISHRGESFTDKFNQVYRFSLSRGFTEMKEAA